MTRTLSLLLAGLTVAACTIPAADELPDAPTLIGFAASQTEVTPGAQVTLSWLANNAVSLRLVEAVSGDEVPLRPAAPDGGVPDAGFPNSVVVTVARTSVYVLTATNARGASTSATVSVKAGGTNNELFFLAAPALIHSGETATLVWNTPGITQVSVTASPGGALPVNQSAAGSVTVQPEFPTTYTLTAGGLSRSVSLPVLPTISHFTAERASGSSDGGSADAGSFTRVRLTWATAGARSVRVSVDGRQVATLTGAGELASGAWEDLLPATDPSRVYLYELTAANDAGVSLSTAPFH